MVGRGRRRSAEEQISLPIHQDGGRGSTVARKLEQIGFGGDEGWVQGETGRNVVAPLFQLVEAPEFGLRAAVMDLAEVAGLALRRQGQTALHRAQQVLAAL